MWDMIDAGYVTLALRHILAWIFLTSSIDKFLHLARFQTTLEQYPRVPPSLAVPLSIVIPALELLVAASLLLGLYWRIGALGAAALLVVFTVALLAALVSGRTELCGCGGLLLTETIGPLHFFSNSLMVAAALIVAIFEESRMALLLPMYEFGLRHTPIGFDAVSVVVAFGTLTTVLSLASAREILVVRSHRSAIDAVRWGI